MAITPRSLTLNPGLLALFCVALGLAAMAWLHCDTSSCSVPATKSVWTPSADCAPQDGAVAEWTEVHWGRHIHCLMDRERGDDAYRAAEEAVHWYPRSENLLNLRGYVAARNGDHAVASNDFSVGKRITGSPSGVFENNLAWSALWQLEGLSPVRTERVLLQSRALYEISLDKQRSCERIHTGLFVEYAFADLKSRQTTAGRNHPEVRDAVQRYSRLHDQYQSCWSRISGGDQLVVEEILSAAVVDQEMGYLAGVRKPIRHIRHLRSALTAADRLGLAPDELCEISMPVASSRRACEAMTR